MSYTNISVKETRDKLSELLERVAIGKESFVITKFNKPKAVIMPVAEVAMAEQNVRRAVTALAGVWEKSRDVKDGASWVANRRRRESSRDR